MGLKESLRVMVVDDTSTSRALLTQSLDAIGIKNYDTQNDGEMALRHLVAKPVHLVISDYNMPKMNGLQLLHGLRVNNATKRIGFILVTGRPEQDIIEAGKKLAMNNFIKKPFTPEQLKACIEKVVGRL